VKNHDGMFSIFWIGLSLFVMFLSNKYGLGEFRDPGPGLMPFLSGLLLLLISLFLLMKSLFKRRVGDAIVEAMKGEEDQVSLRKVSFVLGSLFAFALLLETLGYFIATFFVMGFLFRSMGTKSLRTVLLATFLTVFVSYFLFAYLGLRFPAGVLRILG
jgi:hypothetical protein